MHSGNNQKVWDEGAEICGLCECVDTRDWKTITISISMVCNHLADIRDGL
jgi:hypothetical protein